MIRFADKKPNILKKIWQSIKDFIAKIKGQPHTKSLEKDLAYLDEYIGKLLKSGENKNIDTATDDSVKYSIRNEVANDGTNSEVLGKEKFSTVGGSENNVREYSSNTEKIKGYLGLLSNGSKDLQKSKKVFAGENGWLQQSQKKFSHNSFREFIDGIRGNIQGRRILGVDSIGRGLSSEIKDKFAKTIFADKDGYMFSLYHWTKFKFTGFKKGEFGFHFGTLDASHDIFDTKSDTNISDTGIYKEVYLNITNLLYCDVDSGIWTAYDIAFQLSKIGKASQIFVEHGSNINRTYNIYRRMLCGSCRLVSQSR